MYLSELTASYPTFCSISRSLAMPAAIFANISKTSHSSSKSWRDSDSRHLEARLLDLTLGSQTFTLPEPGIATMSEC
jgi:hypothetical protein